MRLRARAAALAVASVLALVSVPAGPGAPPAVAAPPSTAAGTAASLSSSSVAGSAGSLLSRTAPSVASSTVARTPGPPSAPEYWFDRWDVPQLWNSGARGQGVTIAEVDTGVNAELPELRGRVLEGKDFGVGGDGQIDREVNSFGHGTAMASIMVARPGLLGITGLAPGAKILPVAVPLNGTTDQQRPDRLPDAIRWAADHGADIVNLSIGGKQYPSRDHVPCSASEQQAVFYALRKGVIVVAAVGNTGPTQNTVEDPGACLGVVSVGAVDRSGALASFSAHQPYLTLTAPGVNIPSLGREAGDAFAGDGTSQAAALVSASLALAKSALPKLSGRQLVTRLLATLDGRTATPSSDYGYGTLDAGALVRASVPATAPNPVYAKADPFYRRDASLGAVPGPGLSPAGRQASADVIARPVGRARSLNDQLRLGLALLAVGVLALLGLGTVGLRRRRSDGMPAIPQGIELGAEPAAPGAGRVGPAAPGAPIQRPRPQPSPHGEPPGPGSGSPGSSQL